MKLSLQPSMARAQRGYSLVELSIALAILSVVIVGALLGVQRILDNNRANNLLRQIPLTTASLIAASTSAGASFTGITNVQLAGLGSFPAKDIVKDSKGAVTGVRNEFGGNYLIGTNAAALNGVDIGRGFFLSAAGIPNSMCATVASGVASLANAVYIADGDLAAGLTAAGGNAYKSSPTTPVSVTTLGSACAGTANTKTVTIFVSTQS